MGLVFEERHVVLAIELREGETPPLNYEILMNSDDLLKMLEKHLRDPGKTVEEVLDVEAETLRDKTRIRTTATVEHEGRTYFVVESTAKHVLGMGMKDNLVQVGKFIPLN